MQGNVTWDVGINVSYLQVYGVLDATVYIYICIYGHLSPQGIWIAYTLYINISKKIVYFIANHNLCAWSQFQSA